MNLGQVESISRCSRYFLLQLYGQQNQEGIHYSRIATWPVWLVLNMECISVWYH